MSQRGSRARNRHLTNQIRDHIENRAHAIVSSIQDRPRHVPDPAAAKISREDRQSLIKTREITVGTVALLPGGGSGEVEEITEEFFVRIKGHPHPYSPQKINDPHRKWR